jgi:RHS repeat-associated protein
MKSLAYGAVVSTAMLVGTVAQAANYKAEFENKIKGAQNIGVLGTNLAGDSLDFFSGAVNFSATDISVATNGLPASLSRSFVIEQEHMLATVNGDVYNPEIYSTRSHRFGNWDLDVPRIVTVMTQSGGWILDSPVPANRCSVVGAAAGGGDLSGAPPPAPTPRLAVDPGQYWSGYTLHAGGKQQSLLAATLPNAERPSAGGPYHWTTNADWWVSCLPSLAGPMLGTPSAVPAGQGFLAIAPDGTKYTFNWLSKHNVTAVGVTQERDLNGYGTNAINRVYRAEYEMLATRVEDRFGNWTAYSWSDEEYPRLLSITSGSAGGAAEQTITLGYVSGSSYIASASVQPAGGTARTWTYQYTQAALTRVINPDGSFWEYSLPNDVGEVVPDCQNPDGYYYATNEWYSVCFGGGYTYSTPASGYVIHPSGARVDFQFDNHFLYTSKMGSNPLGLKSKTISGPGLATATWTYDFLPTKQELRDQCYGVSGCPTWSMRDERAPDGSLTRRIFGVDSQLKTTLRGTTVANAGGGTAAIATTSKWGTAPIVYPAVATGVSPTFFHHIDLDYVPDSQVSYTAMVGANPLGYVSEFMGDVSGSQRRAPVRVTTQYLQGTVFKSEVPLACGAGGTGLCMDAFANPTRRVMSSTGGAAGDFSRTETYAYQHDFAKWVVGLPLSTTCTATTDCTPDKVVSSTLYDPTTLLPWKTYSFGALTATLTYDATGKLATATDARDHTTSLSDWKLGVPRLIALPPSEAGPVSISAGLDGYGQIAWTRNEVNSRQCYQYDSMLRLARIQYPSETVANTCSEANWNPLVRSFESVGTAEYGIAAGHWRQTVTIGNGKTTSFYDGFWRPVLVLTEDISDAATRSFVVTRYDGMGRKVFQGYPVGSLTSIDDPTLKGVRMSYDALGRVTRVQQDSEPANGVSVLNTDTSYVSGFKTEVKNPRGFTTKTRYQLFGEPSSDSPTLIELPEGVSTAIDRQPALGKPVTVTRSGTYNGDPLAATRRYVYDSLERLCQTIEPESGTTIVAYDGNDNIAWSADGQVASGTTATSCEADRANTPVADRISRTYDEMNRELTRTTTAGTSNITSTYFADGKLKSLVATNPGGNTVTTTYSYNNRRLLTGEILQVNSLTPWTTAYSYNANGHLSTQTYPGNMTIGYAPDGLGRPTQAGTFATEVKYYPNGAMSSFKYGNGIVHTMTQNARLLPANSKDVVKDINGNVTAVILDDSYTYDANGNVLSLLDASNAPATDKRSWGTPDPVANPTLVTQYDGLDRLLKVYNPNWGTPPTGVHNAVYSYDPLDNLRANRLGASELTYGYNGQNQLASLSYNGGAAQAVTTNARGDITVNAYRGQAYQFDLSHRLSEVSGKESYLYDGNGRRARTLNLQTGTIEYFGYSLDGRLMQDWSNRRQVRNGYVYLGNTLVGLYEVNITNGAINPRYKHTDALGSPVVTTKADQQVMSRMAYTPYGAPTAPMDGVGYTGHFVDVGTQLTYMQQRYYDPSAGRFLSVDPANSEFNRFSYAGNNPLGFVDPDGRTRQKFESILPFPGDSPQENTDSEDEDTRQRRYLAEARAPLVVTNQRVAEGASTTGDVAEEGFWFWVSGGVGRLFGAAVAPLARTSGGGNSGKLFWGFWADYTKVSRNGREYAQIGSRLFSRHAVDRMTPSSFGVAAGKSGSAGRSVSPTFVEHVIRTGRRSEVMVDNVSRTIYWSGNVGVVTEDAARIVVTILIR